jgi:hypothetical protein
MPYKDKVRARETAKERMRRFRERQKKGVTKGVTKTQGVTEGVTGIPVRPMPDGLAKSNAKFKRFKKGER